MPKITVLPNAELCPEGKTFEAETGANLARALLANGVKVQHACEFNCACATCHVIVRQGFDSLNEPSDNELDHLDTAYGACAESRPARPRLVRKTSRLRFPSTTATSSVSKGDRYGASLV